MVQLLLGLGIPANAHPALYTPLSHATYFNLTENVEVLLRHKARPYMKNDSDETALITAIRHGYTECSHLLAECPIPESQRLEYFSEALCEATGCSDFAVAQYLICQGAAPHFRVSENLTALEPARICGKTGTAGLLKKAAATRQMGIWRGRNFVEARDFLVSA